MIHQEPIYCLQAFTAECIEKLAMPAECIQKLALCLQNAFKSYVRTRDYCTTGKHVIQMCLNVIKVSIELGNYVHVNNYISKAEQTPEVQVCCCSRLLLSQTPADATWVIGVLYASRRCIA